MYFVDNPPPTFVCECITLLACCSQRNERTVCRRETAAAAAAAAMAQMKANIYTRDKDDNVEEYEMKWKKHKNHNKIEKNSSCGVSLVWSFNHAKRRCES